MEIVELILQHLHCPCLFPIVCNSCMWPLRNLYRLDYLHSLQHTEPIPFLDIKCGSIYWQLSMVQTIGLFSWRRHSIVAADTELGDEDSWSQ